MSPAVFDWADKRAKLRDIYCRIVLALPLPDRARSYLTFTCPDCGYELHRGECYGEAPR